MLSGQLLRQSRPDRESIIIFLDNYDMDPRSAPWDAGMSSPRMTKFLVSIYLYSIHLTYYGFTTQRMELPAPL